MQKLDKPDCYCIDRDPSTWQPRLHWKASRSLYKQLRSRRILPLLGACNHPDSPSNSSPFSSHALWWNHQSESLTNLDFLPPPPKKKNQIKSSLKSCDWSSIYFLPLFVYWIVFGQWESTEMDYVEVFSSSPLFSLFRSVTMLRIIAICFRF